MTADSLTANHRLANILLGEPLSEYVARHRGEERSWRQIADQLAVDTRGQVAISHETLRNWFGRGDEAA